MQVKNSSLENSGTRFIAIASAIASLAVAVPPARIAAGPLRITQPPELLCSSVWAKQSRQVGCQQSGQEGLLWLQRLLCLPTTLQLTTHCKKTTDTTGGTHYTTPMLMQSIRLPVSFLSLKSLFEWHCLFFLYRRGACL